MSAKPPGAKGLCSNCYLLGSANGTVLCTATATDPDGDPFVYQLSGVTGPFAIDATTGVLTVATGLGWLDFEVTASYVVNVTVAETSSSLDTPLTAYQLVTVTVLDVNEYPYFVVVPANYSLDEESVYPTTVTPQYSNVSVTTSLNPLVSSWTTSAKYIMVYDEDIGNNSALVVTVSCSAALGPGGFGSGYLELVNATGGSCRGNQNCTLRVRAGALRINYDAPDLVRSMNVTLTVTDPTGLVVNSSLLTVAINDVNQGMLWSCHDGGSSVRCAACVELPCSDVLLCDWHGLGLGVVIGVYTAAPRLSPYPWVPSLIAENRCLLTGVSMVLFRDAHLCMTLTSCVT